jgi:hypothetical protein
MCVTEMRAVGRKHNAGPQIWHGAVAARLQNERSYHTVRQKRNAARLDDGRQPVTPVQEP